MDYRNGLPEWTAKWTTYVDYPKLPALREKSHNSQVSLQINLSAHSLLMFKFQLVVDMSHKFANLAIFLFLSDKQMHWK